MVKKYFLIIFLNIFLKFDFRFARRPLVLAVGDHFRYTLNSHFLVRKCKYTKKDQTKKNRRNKTPCKHAACTEFLHLLSASAFRRKDSLWGNSCPWGNCSQSHRRGYPYTSAPPRDIFLHAQTSLLHGEDNVSQ